jgi:hypothetical protein
MFAAGCDAQDEGQREQVMNRLKGVEGFGLNQVSLLVTTTAGSCLPCQVPKIINLMKSVWDTGKPWEALVSGEFFG